MLDLVKNPEDRFSLDVAHDIRRIALAMVMASIIQLSRVVRKPAFCICENKSADHLLIYCTDDPSLCFSYIVEISSLWPSSIPWLYSPICVGPGQKLQRQVFWERSSVDKVDLITFAHDDVYFRNNVNIYNENGTLVEKLIDVKGTEQPPNPCIIGPSLYMITKDRLR